MKEYYNKLKPKYKIILLIISVVILISTMSIVIINIIKNKINKVQSVNSREESKEQIDNVEEFADLKSLETVENKTEQELKEINKKEIEKNQTTNKTNNIKKNKYYIKVNYGAQVVNIYTYDEKGKYTVPVKAFICSTGIETPTSGVYKVPAKIKWCYMYGDVYAQYCTQIVGNILFHSVPYLQRSNDTLEYWAYDKLGTKDSLGCVRLTAIDAKWIFDNIPYGTQVEFYSDSNPGPLGKPTAKKISNAPENLRKWDPTDPDTRNPWRTYKPENENHENNNEISNETSNTVNNTETTNTTNNTINNTTNNQEDINNIETVNNTVNEEQTNQLTNNESVSNNTENNISNEVTNTNEVSNNEATNNNQENNQNLNNELTNTQV